MLPGNGRVDGQKIVDGFACFQKVDERLHRHACMGKARCSVHDLLVDGHHARQCALLLRSHCFLMIGDLPVRGNRGDSSDWWCGVALLVTPFAEAQEDRQSVIDRSDFVTREFADASDPALVYRAPAVDYARAADTEVSHPGSAVTGTTQKERGAITRITHDNAGPDATLFMSYREVRGRVSLAPFDPALARNPTNRPASVAIDECRGVFFWQATRPLAPRS